jgi:hypothetical protein
MQRGNEPFGKVRSSNTAIKSISLHSVPAGLLPGRLSTARRGPRLTDWLTCRPAGRPRLQPKPRYRVTQNTSMYTRIQFVSDTIKGNGHCKKKVLLAPALNRSFVECGLLIGNKSFSCLLWIWRVAGRLGGFHKLRRYKKVGRWHLNVNCMHTYFPLFQ